MTLATDTNIDPSCAWTTDSDMVLGHSLGQDDILVVGGGNGLADGNGSSSRVVSVTTMFSSCSSNIGPLCDH